ncbi:helix-turn-helix domain-containing protein [Lysinibacillus halotolerans]|uniref:DNA-binding protein n=1 Tax=Lysinibacillus halotolerans TaxID=1368476 RepID=A0A3M8HBC2_9BACI|nr:helix-turn-helix domain-containing protein [Lysinibacillus halotolerans]RNC99380.1 DNA-binding protein [Lysinibacillus halotolerans]
MYANKIKGAFKFKRTFYIPLESILKLESDIKNENDLTLTINEVADILKIGRHSVESLFKKGNFPNTYKGVFEWRITKIDLENYRKMIDSPKDIKSEFLTEDHAISYLGFSNKTNIRNLIMNNSFPNAIKEKNYWKIPKSDLDNYLISISNVSIEHSNKVITTPQKEISNLDLGALKLTIIEKFNINELKSLIEKSNNASNINKFSPENEFINLVLAIINNFNNIHFYETTVIYIDFCQIQINNLSGENLYKISRVKSFINLYTKFSKEIQNELSKTQIDSISKLITDDSKLTVHEKKIFSIFVNYYFDIKGIVPKERIYISTKRKTIQEKEIYSPEEFYTLYNYAIDIIQHTKKAVANRNYANMWVYVQLLLTDFIRGQDLIHNTPNIELEHLNISSLNWFNTNVCISQVKIEPFIN